MVEQTGVPVTAEYLIEQEGAVARAKAIAALGLVSRGLHFELFHISDADRVALTRELGERGTSLGEEPEIRRQAETDARRQLHLFQQELGVQPLHISTHGNFNLDAKGEVMQWWNDLMNELFDGNPPVMQLNLPHVRHNLYSWNTDAMRRSPRSPEEFARELRSVPGHEPVEFVLHPALPEKGDVSLNMLFDTQMRIADLESAINIIRSGVIESAGFEIVPVTELQQRARAA
ncbi:MAG: hypothetical protein ABL921_32315 [Pirellula sp.]